MKVIIDLAQSNGPFESVTQRGIQRNIDAQQRAIDGKPLTADVVLLMDTLSILRGIHSQLPE